jgi:hypothetical protein
MGQETEGRAEAQVARRQAQSSNIATRSIELRFVIVLLIGFQNRKSKLVIVYEH